VRLSILSNGFLLSGAVEEKASSSYANLTPSTISFLMNYAATLNLVLQHLSSQAHFSSGKDAETLLPFLPPTPYLLLPLSPHQGHGPVGTPFLLPSLSLSEINNNNKLFQLRAWRNSQTYLKGTLRVT